MAAIIDIITAAYRKANIIPKTATPSAAQGQIALDDLNRMMWLWEANDINLQWYTQTDTTTTYPCAEYTQQGVIGSLAVILCAGARIPVSPELAVYTDQGMEAITRKAMNKKLRPVDMSHLPAGSGWRDRSNILDG